MVPTNKLFGFLVATSVIQKLNINKEGMSRKSIVSTQLLQRDLTNASKEEQKYDSRWHRLLSLRRTRAKTHCHAGRVSPIKVVKKENCRRTVSEIMINVLESDSENEFCTSKFETDLNCSLSESHHNIEEYDAKTCSERRSMKTGSVDDTSNGIEVERPSRQSTFDDKITPIGRILLPIRLEGESAEDGSYGFNSLFISPETALASTVKENENRRNKWKFSIIKKWLEPAENAVNLKIFGGDRGLDKEKQRMLPFKFLIHPYSAFRYDLFYHLICS